MCSTISHNVVDGFGRNLVDTFDVWQGRIVSILVKTRIRMWLRELFNFLSDSSPLRDRAKKRYNTVEHDISKMYRDQVLGGGGMRSTECPSSFWNV